MIPIFALVVSRVGSSLINDLLKVHGIGHGNENLDRDYSGVSLKVA